MANVLGKTLDIHRWAGLVPFHSKSGRAFTRVAALGLAAMMALTLMVSAAMRAWFGDAGVIAVAAVAGMVDTHAAGISLDGCRGYAELCLVAPPHGDGRYRRAAHRNIP